MTHTTLCKWYIATQLDTTTFTRLVDADLLSSLCQGPTAHLSKRHARRHTIKQTRRHGDATSNVCHNWPSALCTATSSLNEADLRHPDYASRLRIMADSCGSKLTQLHCNGWPPATTAVGCLSSCGPCRMSAGHSCDVKQCLGPGKPLWMIDVGCLSAVAVVGSLPETCYAAVGGVCWSAVAAVRCALLPGT